MEQVKEIINQYSEVVNEFLDLLADNTVDMEVEAARIAGAREADNPKSEKIHMAKLDQMIDSFRDQCLELTFTGVRNVVMQYDLVSEEDMPKFDVAFKFLTNICSDLLDDTMYWYREVMIKSSTIAIDSAYHPKKVAADKRELNSMKAQLKADVYSFIETAINKGIEMLKSFGEEIPEEVNGAVDYILEICEDNVADLRSQVTGKVKKNPISRVSSVEDVKQVAEETTEVIEEIKEESQPVIIDEESVYGVQRESFMEISKYFNNIERSTGKTGPFDA